jgi:octaprenyl-diphosphate synthase
LIPFLEPLAPDMARLDALIRQRLDSNVALIRSIAEYIIGAGGKRLRPALLLLLARALRVESSSKYELAAVIEFIHTATLLHDDVVDESSMRRGRKTANAVFGNAASVLVGDFLYSRAFQMMVSVDSMKVMAVMADATNTIAEGEVLQLLNMHDPDVTLDRYMQVIEFKTAKLFEAATRVPAILAGLPPDQEDAMAGFGRKIGSAFQLIDDALDYEGDPALTGKNLGDDLREGKLTYPLIHVLHNGNADQKQTVRAAIEAGDVDAFDAILKAVHATGAIAATRRQATEQAGSARDLLACLPESGDKALLLQLCASVVERQS